MKADLPDLNVLIALAWPNHMHHGLANQWFLSLGDRPWATCPLTQLGFVRLSSNPDAVHSAVTPIEALRLLRAITAQGKHEFWPDDLNLSGASDGDYQLVQGHRQLTDAYLLHLVVKHGGRLVTLDRKMSDLLPTPATRKSSILVLEDR